MPTEDHGTSAIPKRTDHGPHGGGGGGLADTRSGGPQPPEDWVSEEKVHFGKLVFANFWGMALFGSLSLAGFSMMSDDLINVEFVQSTT